MAYVDTPLAGQKVKNTQAPIRQNFVEINNLIAVDHSTFGTANEGNHNKVTLPDQGIAPIFAGNNIGLWSQIPTANPLTLVNELFIRRQDGSTTPFTPKSDSQVAGWTYLPSGILLKWGFSNANGPTTIIYPTAGNIPIFNSVSITLTQIVAPVPVDSNEFVIVVTGASYRIDRFDVYAGTRTQPSTPVPSAFVYLTIGT